jgi:hypothetical protein
MMRVSELIQILKDSGAKIEGQRYFFWAELPRNKGCLTFADKDGWAVNVEWKAGEQQEWTYLFSHLVKQWLR